MPSSEKVGHFELRSFLPKIERHIANIRESKEGIVHRGLYGREIIDKLQSETGIQEDDLVNLLNLFGIKTRTKIPMSELFIFSEKDQPTGFFAFQQPLGELKTIEKASGTFSSYFDKEGSQVIKIAGINNNRVYAATYVRKPHSSRYGLSTLDIAIDKDEEGKVVSHLGLLRLMKTPQQTADEVSGFVSQQMVQKTNKEWRYSFREPGNRKLFSFAVADFNHKIGASFIPPLSIRTGGRSNH